jgi:hypothetical protein
MRRLQILSLFFLGILVLTLLLAVFFFQQQAAGPTLTLDGQGVYESCSPSKGQVCWDRLKTIAQGGFRLVLNYNTLAGSDQDITAYADHAQAVGVKLIWSLKDLWAKPDTTFVKKFIELVKNHPATWGYYINDEAPPSQHQQVKVFSELVHQLDPTHPRLSVACAQCASDPLLGIRPFVDDSADVIGVDYYPIKPGWTIAQTGSLAKALQSLADRNGKQTAMVLQSFSWNDIQHQCDPFPSCAPFPTQDQMRQMRDLTLQNAHPRLILWYSYYNLLKSGNSVQHWQDLSAAARAPFTPSPIPTPTVTPLDSTPTLTSTSNPSSSTTFSFTLCPCSPGNCGDNANPNSGDNLNPLYPPWSENYYKDMPAVMGGHSRPLSCWSLLHGFLGSVSGSDSGGTAHCSRKGSRGNGSCGAVE